MASDNGRKGIRRIGLVSAWVAVVGALANYSFLIPITLTLAILGLVFLTKQRRVPAIVMWSVLVPFTLVFPLTLIPLVWVGDEDIGAGILYVALALLPSVATVLALVASVRIDPKSVAYQEAQRAEQAAPAAHDRRVAEITQWEAAYRDAHGGQSPPPGFMPPVAQTQMFGQQSTNIMAVLALVFGIGGGLLGVVFGHIALSQIKKTGERGKGMAIWGLTLGYVGLSVLLVYLVVLVVVVNS